MAAILLFLISPFCFVSYAEESSSVRDYSPGAGFYTNAFDVRAAVGRDKSILIEEIIDTEFFQAKHGIYRYIPLTSYESEVYQGAFRERKVQMKISEIQVGKKNPDSGQVDWGGYHFESFYENGNRVIQIGSGDYTITGRQIYVIQYKVRFYEDEWTEYDSIYYDFIPHDWATPIESSSVQITLPGADTDVSGAEFIAGSLRGSDTELFTAQPPLVDDARDTVTLAAELNGRLAEREGMTFLLRLPEGFFEGELDHKGLNITLWALIVGPFVIIFLLWIFIGRDKKPVQTVEFYPPDDLNPAEIGYLIDGKVDDKDLLAMILFWASQGYLTIEETEKGKFTLTRTEKDASDFDEIPARLFQSLFLSDGKSVDLSKRNSPFAAAMSIARDHLKKQFNEGSDGLINKKSLKVRKAGVFLSFIPLVMYFIVETFMTESSSSYTPAILILLVVGFMFVPVGMAIIVLLYTGAKHIVSSLRWKVIFIVVPLIAIGFPYLIKLFPVSTPMSAGAFISVALCGFFSYHIARKSDYYCDVLGKIRGFKNFIKTAEIDRLKVLFDEDPAYFYNILPYAWVFGLSDKWSEKFETIAKAPPVWYRGFYGDGGTPTFKAAYFASSLDRYEQKSSGKFSSKRVSGSSAGGSIFFNGGGGFSGGGGSFSGGGGSSGGGSGGGGGGSW
ncbi:MAG: DUF2207 domain-containing protein [Clostridiales Family XIII bacterium]|nr:DUF2207 domain-containing protein [Clostridiales Family XIII bacterium]